MTAGQYETEEKKTENSSSQDEMKEKNESPSLAGRLLCLHQNYRERHQLAVKSKTRCSRSHRCPSAICIPDFWSHGLCVDIEDTASSINKQTCKSLYCSPAAGASAKKTKD